MTCGTGVGGLLRVSFRGLHESRSHPGTLQLTQIVLASFLIVPRSCIRGHSGGLRTSEATWPKVRPRKARPSKTEIEMSSVLTFIEFRVYGVDEKRRSNKHRWNLTSPVRQAGFQSPVPSPKGRKCRAVSALAYLGHVAQETNPRPLSAWLKASINALFV